MKNISTGTGIALLAGAILGSTIIIRYGPADQAAHAAPPMEAAKAVAAAVTAQVPPEPTIVWYGAVHNGRFAFCSGSCLGIPERSSEYSVLFRAWSDGRVEGKKVCTGDSCGGGLSAGGWFVISDPNSGYNAAADINFDSKVDGADLSQVLNDWGNAPRQDIPPSTCPLNLINPR